MARDELSGVTVLKYQVDSLGKARTGSGGVNEDILDKAQKLLFLAE